MKRDAPARRAARVKRVAAGVAALIVTLWVTIYWVEAEKEIVVLCGLSSVGTAAADVQRLHRTASLVKLRVDSVGPRITTRLASRRNLSLTTCTVNLKDGAVATSDYRERPRLAPLLGLRRSLRVEDRVPAAAMSAMAPHSVLGEVLVGIMLLLSTGAFVVVLWVASLRWRWPMGVLLLVLTIVGAILLLGG